LFVSIITPTEPYGEKCDRKLIKKAEAAHGGTALGVLPFAFPDVGVSRKSAEETGSQSYVPPDEKDDRTLKEAFNLLRGTITDAAFPPNPKAAAPQ
jgi:hypothetical protein